MIAELSSLIASSKAAYDIAKGINALKSEVDRNEAISKILEVLISVQAQALSVNAIAQDLQQEKYDLKNKILQFENWAKTERQYELKEVAPGMFVYNYKIPVESAKPSHWLCPKCFQEKKTYILQLRYDGTSGPKEYISFLIPCSHNKHQRILRSQFQGQRSFVPYRITNLYRVLRNAEK